MVDDAVARLPDWSGSGADLQLYTCRVTFELIAAVILGKRVGALDRAAPDPRDDAFVHATLASQQAGAALLYGPLGKAAAMLKTPSYRRFVRAMDYVLERSAEHIEDFSLRHNVAIGADRPQGATAPGGARPAGGGGGGCPFTGGGGAASSSSGSTATGGGVGHLCGVEPYLSRVLSAGALSRAEVVLNVGGLLQGGVDTTANTLGWLLAHLAAHPAEQDALAAELHRVLGDGGARR